MGGIIEVPPNSWNVSKINSMVFLLSLPAEVGDNFNEPLNCWDTSNVVNMDRMFLGNKQFNYPIGNWNVSKVTNMNQMFEGAKKFNQDITNWNVEKVTTATNMFKDNMVFNQDISNWKLSALQNMEYMFQGASSFNQNLCAWYCAIQQQPAYPQFMFDNTACPNKDGPNYVTKASYCTQCNNLQCNATTPANPTFTDQEWMIQQQVIPLDIVYTDQGANLTLKYTAGIHNISLKLFQKDCVSAITTNAAIPVLVGGNSSNPIISNINIAAKTQNVAFVLSAAASSLNVSNIYTNGNLIFCARVDLLDAVNGNSLSVFQNIVNVTFNLTALLNFQANDTAVADSGLGGSASGVIGLTSSLLACLCNESDVTYSCTVPPPVLSAGSFLSVCVSALTSKVKIVDVTKFKISQYGTNLFMDAISNGTRSPLTTSSISTNGKGSRIKTQLQTSFFDGLTASNKGGRQLKAEGTVALRLIDGSRHLVKVKVDIEGDHDRQLTPFIRIPEGKPSSSEFAVDRINLDESPSKGRVKVQPEQNVALTVCTVLFAAGICCYLMFALVARKRKRDRLVYSNPYSKPNLQP